MKNGFFGLQWHLALDKTPVLWPTYLCADLIDQLAGAEEVRLKRDGKKQICC